MREVNLHHENHRSDEQTFKHYPENLRLNADKQLEAEKLISLGVNKQRLKMYLMKDGSTVPIKILHNIQTKQRNSYKKSSGQNELKDLLEEMNKVPNAKVRVYVNDEEELIGKFYHQSCSIYS